MAVVKLNHGNAGAHLVGIYAGVEDLIPEISIDDSCFLVSHLVRFVDAIASDSGETNYT